MRKTFLGVFALMVGLAFLCLPMGISANETTGTMKLHEYDSETGTVRELFAARAHPETPGAPGTQTDAGDANLQANTPTETDAFAKVTNDAQVPAEQSAAPVPNKVMTSGNAGGTAGNGENTKLPQVLAEVPTALAVWWDGLPETENGVLIRVVCIVAGALLVVAIILSVMQAIRRYLRRQKLKRVNKIADRREEPRA